MVSSGDTVHGLGLNIVVVASPDICFASFLASGNRCDCGDCCADQSQTLCCDNLGEASGSDEEERVRDE
jgi:hypothetical protein